MKTCSICKIKKPTSDFWKDKAKKSGFRPDCIDCAKLKGKAFRIANRDINRRKSRDKYKGNPLVDREKHLKRKYSITQKQYEALLAEQNGECEICKKKQVRAFDVDHCHTTGKVRGLLCTSCNRMLGHAHDNAERLIAASAYLLKSRQSSSKPTKDAGHDKR